MSNPTEITREEWDLWMARLRDPESTKLFGRYKNLADSVTDKCGCALGHLMDVLAISRKQITNDGKPYDNIYKLVEEFPTHLFNNYHRIKIDDTDHNLFNVVVSMNDRQGLSLPQIADKLEPYADQLLKVNHE